MAVVPWGGDQWGWMVVPRGGGQWWWGSVDSSKAADGTTATCSHLDDQGGAHGQGHQQDVTSYQ